MKATFIFQIAKGLCLLLLSSGFSHAQSLNQNFVRSDEMWVPVSDESAIENLVPGSRKTEIGYADKWGRAVQLIGLGQSPSQGDFIQMNQFDAYNRNSKSYLPFAQSGNNGAFLPDAELKQKMFYQGTAKVAQSNFPFAESSYDGSPLNRKHRHGAPGAAWQLNTNHAIQVELVLNGAGAHPVRKWEIGAQVTAPGFYSDESLSGHKTTDEDGKIHFEFSDTRGNLVYQKIRNVRIEYDTQGLPFSVEEWLQTYWIYDEYGLLRFAVPPKAVQLMEASSNWDLSALTEDLIFSYTYDKRGRMIQKHVPGGGETELVYDNLDRPVLSQNAAQKTRNEWVFTKYDRLGRPVLTGLLTTPSVNSRSSLQSLLDGGTYPLFELRSGLNFSTQKGYTQFAFPTPFEGICDIQTVTWYDDYDFDLDGMPDISYLNDPDAEFSDETTYRLRNQVTGTETKVLAPTGITVPTNWLSSVIFYDTYGRTVQTRMHTHLGEEDISWTSYDFSGKVLESKTLHRYNQAEEVTVRNSFRYDHAGRLIKIYQQNNDDPQILVSEKKYNEAGQLVEENIHSNDNGGSFLQSMDYGYHIRGWLTQINDPDLVNEQSHQQGNWQTSTLRVTLNELSNGQGQTGIYANLILGRQQMLDDEPVGVVDYLSETLFVREEDTVTVDSGYLQMKAIEGVVLQPDVTGLSLDAPSQNASLAAITAALTSTLDAAGVPSNEAQDEVSLLVQNWISGQHNGYYVNDDPNDLFGLEIRYDRGLVPLQGDPRYNGHISAITWKSASDGQKRAYGFRYDDVGRLHLGDYAGFDAGNQIWSKEADHFSVPQISYDFNGNILSLERQGWLQGNSFGQMDDLAYSYSGNRLLAVNDAAAAQGNNDFYDNGSTTGVEYTYDASGNMLSDANRGISVVYNHFNKPVSVDFGGGREVYWGYDGSGAKLRKVTRETGQADRVRDYVAGFEYQDGDLAFFPCEKGKVVPDPNNGLDFRYEYYYSDHLGNTRLGFSDLNGDGSVDETEIIQEMHYYPYGMTLSGLGTPQVGPEYRYGYNGVELQADFDLNWWDTYYRGLDPALGRWTGVDPKADARENPYMAMAGDPIMYSDAMGDTIIFSPNATQVYKDNYFKAIEFALTHYNVAKAFYNVHTADQNILILSPDDPIAKGFSDKDGSQMVNVFIQSGGNPMATIGDDVVTGVIIWDDDLWMRNKPIENVFFSDVPPSTILAHEVGHASNFVELGAEGFNARKLKPRGVYTNEEEEDVMVNIESKITDKYAGKVRLNHESGEFFNDAAVNRGSPVFSYIKDFKIYRRAFINKMKKISK